MAQNIAGAGCRGRPGRGPSGRRRQLINREAAAAVAANGATGITMTANLENECVSWDLVAAEHKKLLAEMWDVLFKAIASENWGEVKRLHQALTEAAGETWPPVTS